MFDLSNLRETDYGFFGPGSPTWKIWTSPTALIGFQRSVVLEHFDPHLTAAVADMDGIYADPQGRLDRTLAYFQVIATADSKTCIAASEHLMSVHAKANGIDPITGKRYSANNPASQLWIHVTGWHSVLKAYEMYGPGPLPEAEEKRYWAECVIAAELQTCNPADVPRSREEVRAYFAEMRPKLCSSERAQRAMHYLLRTNTAKAGPLFWAGSRYLAPATIASLPKWMRTTGNFDQSLITDRAVVPVMQLTSRALSVRAIANRVLPALAPMTAQVFEAHQNAGEPRLRTTVSPSQARELYGRRSTSVG